MSDPTPWSLDRAWDCARGLPGFDLLLDDQQERCAQLIAEAIQAAVEDAA